VPRRGRLWEGEKGQYSLSKTAVHVGEYSGGMPPLARGLALVVSHCSGARLVVRLRGRAVGSRQHSVGVARTKVIRSGL